MAEITNIVKTKIVSELPSVTESNTQYLVKNGENKFDIFQTDRNNKVKQLQINVNRNLLKHSSIMMLLYQVPDTGRPGNPFMRTRLWDEPSVYGIWEGVEKTSNAVWGVQTYGEELNFHIFEEDLRNKEITVSVDVMCPDYEVIIGLNKRGDIEMPFTLEKGKWKRIYTTVTTTLFPGIVAKLKNNSSVKGNHNSLSTNIFYKNWKVEYGKIMTDWTPAVSDLASFEVSFVKTNKLTNPASFRTDEPIETRYQDGMTVGLTSENTSIRVFYNKYTFKCKYIFLKDNSSVTFTGISRFKTNSFEGLTFRGNKGDFIDFSYFQDESNVTLAVANITRLQDESVFVIPITATTSLNSSHVGRVLQFNNTGNINIDITNLPVGATVSGVKNNTGTITFIGTTAPSSDNVLNGAINSSFSLIKNTSGLSNLLINNK